MLIDIEYSKLRIREISIYEVDTIVNSGKFYIFGLSPTKNISFYKNVGEVIKKELDDVDEIYSLEEGDEVEMRISEKNEYERKVISSIINLIQLDVSEVKEWQKMYELIQVLEVLVRCLRNEGLNKQFYNKRISHLYLTTKTLKPDITSYQSKSLAFKNGKHDVLDVINILLESEDDVFINLGSDYNIDEVRNITTVSHRSSSLKENDWVKLVRLGKLGNKIRDNISIAYLIPAEIEIPKNKVGIPEGKFETVRKLHLCIIKDGYYWKDYLTVRVSPNVCDKLKRTGIEMEELTEGEYMLSLKSLPLYSRKRFNITDILGGVGNILGELRDLKWKRYLYLESKDYEKTEKEKFLESLGIVDGICEKKSKKSESPKQPENKKKEREKKEIVQSFCIETITPDILPAVKRNEWEENPTGPEVIERFTELSNKLVDLKLALSCINKFQSCGLAVQNNNKYNINWRCKRGSIEIPLVPYNW